MLEEVRYCKNIVKYKFNKPLKMTNVDEEEFQKADKCHICGISYNEKDIRVHTQCNWTDWKQNSYFPLPSAKVCSCYMLPVKVLLLEKIDPSLISIRINI